jgi:hypothetical protein
VRGGFHRIALCSVPPCVKSDEPASAAEARIPRWLCGDRAKFPDDKLTGFGARLKGNVVIGSKRVAQIRAYLIERCKIH